MICAQEREREGHSHQPDEQGGNSTGHRAVGPVILYGLPAQRIEQQQRVEDWIDRSKPDYRRGTNKHERKKAYAHNRSDRCGRVRAQRGKRDEEGEHAQEAPQKPASPALLGGGRAAEHRREGTPIQWVAGLECQHQIGAGDLALRIEA